MTYKNKDSYTGDFENGLKAGNGKYTWSTGESDNGAWASDKINGQGEYRYSSKEYPCIKGVFKDNKPSSKIVYYVNSSQHYDTEWKNGKCTKIKE